MTSHAPLMKESHIVRLRGHHLLCMLTWAGQGYNEDFTSKFNHIVTNIKLENEIEIVSGPDDLCTTLCGCHPHHDTDCTSDGVKARDEKAFAVLNGTLGLGITAGSKLVFDTGLWGRMQDAFHSGVLRSACVGCEWFSLCTELADRNFVDTQYERIEPLVCG